MQNGYWAQSIIKKDTLGQEFCYIPAGTFLYGKEHVTSRILSPFYMSRFPITNIQFRHFVNETGYAYELFDVMDQLSAAPGCPATPVSWQNAKAYARWLRTLTGEYYSLPSEEEWELAARGTDGRPYPWGKTPPTDEHGTFSIGTHRSQTSVVGSHPLNVSPYGVADMVGNVWEWCLDEIDELGEAHIMRGGSCVNDETYCNCNSRCYESPSDKRVLYASIRLVYLPEEMYERYRAAIEGGMMSAPADGDLTRTLR